MQHTFWSSQNSHYSLTECPLKPMGTITFNLLPMNWTLTHYISSGNPQSLFLLAGTCVTCSHVTFPKSYQLWQLNRALLKWEAKSISLTKGKMLNKIFKFLPLQTECFQPGQERELGVPSTLQLFVCMCSQQRGATVPTSSMDTSHLTSHTPIPAKLLGLQKLVSWSQNAHSWWQFHFIQKTWRLSVYHLPFLTHWFID